MGLALVQRYVSYTLGIPIETSNHCYAAKVFYAVMDPRSTTLMVYLAAQHKSSESNHSLLVQAGHAIN